MAPLTSGVRPMGIFGVPILFGLLLAGISLLLVPRPESPKRDWPLRLSAVFLGATPIYAIWLRQASKFEDGQGLFFALSPALGLVALSLICFGMFVAFVSVLWKALDD